MDVALNNLQRLICHETQPTDQHYSIRFRFLKKKEKKFVGFSLNILLIEISENSALKIRFSEVEFV